MSARGAGDPPITYQGEYDTARTYLPRQLVTVGTTPYLSTAKQQGVDPPGATWLLLGGVSLWVGTSAPTDGSVLWYDTDATC